MVNTSLLQKRVSTLTRLIPDVFRPSFYPTAQYARAFWWSDTPNFGDLITPFLLRQIGIAPILKPAKSADLLGAGSVLELLGEDYRGIIWGSGKMHEHEETKLPHAQFLGVRGHLTRTALGLSEDTTTVGDPGLLMSDYVKRKAPTVDIAVIPHFSHQQEDWVQGLREEASHRSLKIIDVGNSPLKVVEQIAQARYVLTTSLHGLICADALGVPAAWALPEPVLAGATFKFRDYSSVVDPQGKIEGRFDSIENLLNPDSLKRIAQSPDSALVKATQENLRNTLHRIPQLLPTPHVLPLTLPVHQYRP